MNGMRPSKTAFVIDGVNATNQWIDGVVTQPSPDAIEEFKVQSNALSAEFGQGGGIISIQLKSGTNDYHATLFEFLRNDALDARNFFNPAPANKGVVKQNQFGSAGGGPIVKNRTFFFADYQATRQRRASFFNTRFPRKKCKTGISRKSAPRFLTRDHAARSGESRGDYQRPFPGKSNPREPAFRPARYTFENNFILAPNTPDGFFNRAARSSDSDQFDIRVDHQFRQGTRTIRLLQPAAVYVGESRAFSAFGRQLRRSANTTDQPRDDPHLKS